VTEAASALPRLTTRPLPGGSTTRFAPAPTGRLHLGHLANAIYVWGLAGRAGGRVVLRIEDHDRQRCRPEYAAALLDDLDRLGIVADEPTTDELRAGPSPYRQSDNGPAYEAALAQIGAAMQVYACDCARSTFAAWREMNAEAWSGPGCPGRCRERGLDVARRDLVLRAALGDGEESWDDVLAGARTGRVAREGDLPLRDRNGNWTYAFCVVVDDIRHGIDLVVRGEDLLDATAPQIRLARLMGRETPPTFAHHPLIRRPDGTKLSKADGATAVGELLDEGHSPEELLGRAAHGVGLVGSPRPVPLSEAIRLAGTRP
jgi:glutamyl/glutaminyl-tRNA synthetase